MSLVLPAVSIRLQAWRTGGWQTADLERSLLPLEPAGSALLDFDFGSALPPANPSQGIVLGCAWPGHATEHLAAQRSKMRALLQELGVRVHSTHVRTAGRPPVIDTPQVPTPPQEPPPSDHMTTLPMCLHRPTRAVLATHQALGLAQGLTSDHMLLLTN